MGRATSAASRILQLRLGQHPVVSSLMSALCLVALVSAGIIEFTSLVYGVLDSAGELVVTVERHFARDYPNPNPNADAVEITYVIEPGTAAYGQNFLGRTGLIAFGAGDIER